MSTFVFSLPQWLALTLILASVVLPALLGFLVVQRLRPVDVRRSHNDVAGFVFAAVGVIYGVLLAFVVIVVWEHWEHTEDNVQMESVVALSRYNAIDAYDGAEKGREGPFVRWWPPT